jgi:biopolymer transport protein ExbD
MELERTRRKAREIDLTPLIDIVFQLVIFFMLTTSFTVSESIELSLPSVAGNAPPAEQFMRIAIARGGAVSVDAVPMSALDLERLLVDRFGNYPDTKIVILTTPGVSVQEMVRVMDQVYLSGGRNLQVDRAL